MVIEDISFNVLCAGVGTDIVINETIRLMPFGMPWQPEIHLTLMGRYDEDRMML